MKTKLLYVLLLICSYSYAQTFPTNDIQGYYKFTSGAVLSDDAGVANLAQNGMMLAGVTDRFNSANGDAVQLNSDYLSRPNIPTSRSVTHAFWIKTTTNNANNEFIIGDSDRPGAGFNSTTYGYDIILRDGGVRINSRFRERENNGAMNDRAYNHASNSLVADGAWHHVAFVFYTNGTNDRYLNSRIYIDGALDSSNQYDTTRSVITFPFNTGDVVIGNNRVQNLADANKYKDEFDDYFVYNRILDATEIRTLATQDGYCLVPQNNIISASIVTEDEATINVTLNSNTYDVAYGLTSESIANATILSNVSSTINLTGLTASTDYNVYIREQCASGLTSDWSAPISFRTLGPIYVDDTASGLNDGSSWQNAFTDLKSALDIDIDGQEIWVAGGTYKTQAQNSSFLIDKTNVSLYGGFAGTETLLSQRVLGTNESIITGDINSDDDPNTLYQIDATRLDNTRRLIVLNTSSDNSIIDGFTITAGMGTPSRDAGGIYNVGADDVLVSNCKFFRNAATGRGGAILAAPSTGGQMTIESCVFEENFSLHGGAIYQLALGASNTVNVNKSIFLNNMATGAGAAIFSYASGNNCHFNLDANEFVGNNARSGAIHANVQNNATLSVSITNSLFNGNIAEDNSTGAGNSGSAAWLRTRGASSTLTSTIVNNTFVNNIDTGTATGLNNFNRATLALTKDNAGATHNATVSNNIFYNNRGGTSGTTVSKSISGLNETMATITVENSIDENNFSSIPAGSQTNTSSAEPQFTNAAGNDYTLGATTSPAINSGNTNAVTTTSDLLGNARIYGAVVDMGAYEYVCSGNCFAVNVTTVGSGNVTQNGTFYNNGDNVTVTATPIAGWAFIGWTGDITSTNNPLNINNITSDYNLTATFIKAPIYVDENATGNNDGTSWANAYTDLQDALAITSVDDEIWLANGTYNPVTPVTPAFPTTAERQVSFNISTDGVILYGGFAGTELQLSDRDMALIHTANETILSGDLGRNDNATIAYSNSTRTDNSYRIIDITANNIILDGVSLSSGNSDATSGEGRYGAALRTAETVTDFTIRKSMIKNNIGMFSTGLALFSDAATSRMTIDACIFEKNLSGFASGFFALPRASRTMHIVLTNSLFNNNRTAANSTRNGSGASAGYIRANYTNSVIDATVVNNTFVNNVNEGTNTSDFGTLGISRDSGDYASGLDVSNNIFWGNTTNGGAQALAIGKIISSNLPSGMIVNHSTDEDNFSNLGTFNTSNADPLFTDAVNGDFTLTNTSPAKNTGRNSSVTTSFDLFGNPRVLEVTVDMGAYEYNSSLGIDDVDLVKNQIKLYPNPTSSILNIEMKSNLKQATIYNVLGAEVLNTSTKSINTSNLKSGMYLLKIEDENGSVSTKRFIKR